ncbi:arginine repressor [Fodinicola feengrottensis]|uniref:hypothetical protein n=1 Tax=Fodinicola feengrottensis TaxID=435914 RepID=UPI002442B580|nr:hypothetical protein [Fodinicola feengrottensis]
MTSAAPPTKTARHARISELVRTRAVKSQTELVGLLAEHGMSVTQATLSRDLEELGAVKTARRGRRAVGLRHSRRG